MRWFTVNRAINQWDIYFFPTICFYAFFLWQFSVSDDVWVIIKINEFLLSHIVIPCPKEQYRLHFGQYRSNEE